MMRNGWTVGLLLLLGCAGGDKGEDDQAVQTDVVSIRIEPESIELVTSLDEAAQTQFTAYATLPDGTEFETDMVTWETSNLSAGSVDETGRYTASTLNGGVSEISATHVGVAGLATVTVVYEADLVENEEDAGLVDAFAAASPSNGDLPELTYPLDGVSVPRNLEGLAFQWDMPDDANASRIRMTTDITDIRIHVTDDTWMSNSDLWALIVASNTEGDVSVRIESGNWNGTRLTDVQRGPRTRLTVNRLDARGSVLYWALRVGDPNVESEGSGDIMRIPFGLTEAEYFWTAEDAQGECTGCHTLSERSNRMVVTHQGVNGRFTVVDVTDPELPVTVVAAEDDRRATFHTISPDGLYMVGIENGSAFLYSMANGQRIEQIDTQGYTVSHPDWSPDGEDILLVRSTGAWFSDMDFEGGEIIQIPFNDGAWGPPEVLAERSETHNNYYPAYSPDGEWIAFNRAVETDVQHEGQPPMRSSTSKANPSAEVWLMRRDGSDWIRLEAANGEGELKNSFPRWGPLPDDDVLWLAFSSVRTYTVDPSMSGLPQIWITAIDPKKVESGEDPSSAPFWLPGQDSQSDNHLPVWWSK